MKILKHPLALLPLLIALVPWATSAQTPNPGSGSAPVPDQPSMHAPDMMLKHHFRPKMEKVTFLGVETRPMDPALATQLSLPADFGLVVTTVVPGSPASGVLKEYDILLKLQDQRLVDSRQLAALIRARKPGDSVGLTLVRKGREQTVQVKLGQHELPRMLEQFGENGPMIRARFGGPMMMTAHQFPRPEAYQMFSLLRGDRDPAHTRIIVRREGFSPKAAVMDLGHSTIVYHDDQGTLELTMDNGRKQLVAKDKSGKILFSGPIDTEKERKAVPREVMARLQLIERARDFGAGVPPPGAGQVWGSGGDSSMPM